MKIEKVITKLEKIQDKVNQELDALREMFEDHLEEMESEETYDESDEMEEDDFSDDEESDED